MKVYVVETGVYSERAVAGVYATPDAAMQAHPIPADYQYPKKPSAANYSRPGGWIHLEDGRWDNQLDHGDATTITEHEVRA